MSPSLRGEIRQVPPFQSLEQEAYLGIVRTASLLTDHFERLLREPGITLAQYNVLRILRGAGQEGLCRNDLRARLLTRMPDVTRLLDRMEAAGLVTRTRGEGDRRLVTTHITPRGARMLDDLADAVSAEHRRRFAMLDEAQLTQLIELLERVREKL